MSYEQSRRALLTAAALLPPAACGADEHRASVPPGSPSAPPSGGPSLGVDAAAGARARLAALERRHGARLGVYALATGTGATLTHRADERFAFCSTFKALAAAAVLHRNPLSHLDDRVTFTRADVDSISPITQHHVATGMTVRELCEAAIRYSDGTTGNLLMRDTTTPRAIAADYRALVLGDVLDPAKRALLEGWLVRTTTGTARIRAGLPKGWKPARKTGTGDHGRANDIAVVWPPGVPPLVVAVMSDRPGYGTPPREALIAEATRVIVAALT